MIGLRTNLFLDVASVSAAALMGCGGTSTDPQGNELGTVAQDLGTPVVGTGLFDSDDDQSETDISVSNLGGENIITTAYNDGTQTFCYPYPCTLPITYDQTHRYVHQGASLMGWSYSVDQGATWTHGKLAPPAGWSVLWGDPAIGRGNNSQSYVFMSNLAVPDANFPSGQGYISGSLEPYLGGACIARSTDGGKTFAIYQCVSNNNHFYDGGSIAVDSSGRVFFATNDVTAGTIDVWRANSPTSQFNLIANPFPGYAMESHPRIRAWDNNLYIIAQHAGDDVLLINKYVNSWATPGVASQAPHNPTTEGGYVTFQNGKDVRFGPQFSFDVADASAFGNDHIRILFTEYNAGKHSLYATVCNTSLQCWAAPEWSTESESGDQFHPSVAAYPGFIGSPERFEATYWSRHGDASGSTVKIKHGALAVIGSGTPARVFVTFDLTASQTVCPDWRGYWGDYQGTKYAFLNGSTPKFLTTFTDSSAGCDKYWQYDSHNVHVSAVTF